MTRTIRSYIAPNPKEFDYWVDLTADPKGNVIKYYAGKNKWLPINDDTDNGQNERIKALEDSVVTVENSLTSDSIENALSAKQGNVLKGLIDALTARVTALENA